jgi:Protein of unknown function (DUF1571)
MKSNRKLYTVAGAAVLAVLPWLALRGTNRNTADGAGAAPAAVSAAGGDLRKDEITMADVLQMASDAHQHMSEHLDDYSARFIKQERNEQGILGEVTEFEMKVQTRFRSDSDNAPMRVYLNYLAPENVKGREVIWAEDLNDGKMVVHEVGLLLGMKRIWLDPNGMIAMQGQRYPISEIGIVRLVEKLLERGEKDRDNPDIKVTLTDHTHDDVKAQLIRVERSKPSGGEDDFSLAEIIIDPQRQLILQYRSFGWPQQAGETPPLLESYTYHDVKTNVGLTDIDFSPDNPSYNFPAF